MKPDPSAPGFDERSPFVAGLASFLAGTLLAVVAMAAFQGVRPARFDETLAPGPVSYIAFIVGWLALIGARRGGIERWGVFLVAVAVGTSAFAPPEWRRTIVLAATPLLIGAAMRPHGIPGGVGLFLAFAVGGFLGGRLPISERYAVAVGALGLAVVAFLLPATVAPRAARFDLRAALGFAVIILGGLVIGCGFTLLEAYARTPKSYGGVGLGPNAGPGAWWGVGLLVTSAVSGFGERPIRIVLSLGAGILGAVALFIPTPGTYWIGLVLLVSGVGYPAASGFKRASRAARGWGILAIGLSTMGGMSLAPALVRAFSRPLPGLITVDGAEVSQRTQWTAVFGFYAALATVVLLAFLAFAYEFGLEPLDPDNSVDPLPIKRKGLAGLRKA